MRRKKHLQPLPLSGRFYHPGYDRKQARDSAVVVCLILAASLLALVALLF